MARKSRRKTKRSRNSTRWKAIALWGLLGLFVAVTVTGFGAFIAIRSYLQSEKFRIMLGEKASEVLKAKTEFSQFTWTGARVSTDKVTAFGHEEAVFSKLKAEGVSATVDIGAAWGGVWRITEVNINRVNALLDSDDRLSGSPPSVEKSDDGGGFFSSFIPEEVEVVKARIGELNFDIRTGEEGLTRGRNWVAELAPSSTEGIWKMRSKSGSLELDGLDLVPKLELQDLAVRIGEEKMFIDDASFGAFEKGRLNVSGEVSFGEDGDLALVARFNEIDASEVVSGDWVKRIHGRVGGRLELNGSADDEGGIVKKGKVTLENGVLEALPVLEKLESLTNTKKFRRLYLSQLKVGFEQNKFHRDINDFILDSSGTICLKGHAHWETNQLQGGSYMFGIAPDVIQWMPAWKKIIVEQMFSSSLDSAFNKAFAGRSTVDIEKPPSGYLWTVVKIDPSAAEPFTADLRRQLLDAGGLAILAELEGLSEQAIEKARVVAEAAIESGTDLADVMSEHGIDSIDRLLSEDGIDALGGMLQETGVLELPKGLFDQGMKTLNGLNPFR